MNIRRIRRRVFTLALLAIPAFAADDTDKRKEKPDYTYLALGDSISFGLDIRLLPTGPGQPLPDPNVFIGYPEVLAATAHAEHVNASCPGETAASFLDSRKPDNGCNGPGPQGQPPFKTSIGLHTAYKDSKQDQLDFAMKELEHNKHVSLVTLSIGGNEILLILKACENAANVPACVGAILPGALKTYKKNLDEILHGLRKHYKDKKDTIVVVQYYSPSPDLNDIVGAFNGVMAEVGEKLHVRLADGFAAFQKASEPFQGDACKAGLLVRLGPNNSPPCDVHPSLLGQQVLAAAVTDSLLP